MKTFSEFSLSSVLNHNLAKHSFVEPTPVQSEAIPPALAGSDVVATFRFTHVGALGIGGGTAKRLWK